MASNPLSLLFLWHQHQPLYKDSLANRYEMPWARLHATKDYYDMAALLEEFPSIKANYNLVPSLLAQLDDYATSRAQDKIIELTLKRATQLSFEDQRYILENFFMAHWEHMIDPYPRYRELLDKRGRNVTSERLSRVVTYFKEQDWRDLQMWFNLAWFDPLWREKDPFINKLFEKGKNFTEEEKLKLIDKALEVCKLVVPKHKELQEKGQIEVTTTPFYHPILPLLCDTEAARMALPHMMLPQHRFMHPEDARTQVSRAIQDYKNRFGRGPQGMWPSEGSVSEEAAQIFIENGIRWIATDEAVLAHSLPGFQDTDLYEPYQFMVGDKSLHFFFRNHELSDAIGFVYAPWEPEAAAEDFMRRLHHIKDRLDKADGNKPRPHVVPVILDGENCWEYYKDDGLPFLRALYKRLSADPEIQTVRASDYLDRTTDIRALPKLWSGSWINANFAIWIGHSEDNMAWDLLSRTRNFLEKTLRTRSDLQDTPQASQAWEEIFIAEGSDWCWWYGDDHSSANDETFDYLFRKHLMNVYTLLGEKAPEDLHLPIKKKRVKTLIHPPTDFITPQLDGRVTSYFEWHAAGSYSPEAGATGTMHKSENLIKTIYYGFDLASLHFRIDLNRPITPELLTGLSFKLSFLSPSTRDLAITFAPNNNLLLTLENLSTAPPQVTELSPGAYQKIIEFSVPLTALNNAEKADFEVFLVLQKDGLEQERWPAGEILTISYPTSDVFVDNWVI